MSLVFDDDFESYAIGATVPGYPSTLGGKWSKWGFFGGSITDEDSFLPGGKSLKYETTGAIRWEDPIFHYSEGAIRFAFKAGTSPTGLFNLLDLYDRAFPFNGPYPQPVLLFRLDWEDDSTLTARIGALQEFVVNSGYAHTALTPLGILITEPFAADPDTWYIFQFNFAFSESLGGDLHVSFCVHINDQPILAGDADSTLTVGPTYPSNFPPTFNQIELITVQNPTSYLDYFLFDNDKTLEPGGGNDSFARATQAILEPLTLPNDTERFARVTQGVIEIDTEPNNFARVTQAVIELLTTTGSGPTDGGWRVWEA